MSAHPRSSGATCGPLPSPLPELVRAAGAVAAAAVERGDLVAARRALEEGLYALDAGGVPHLRLVTRTRAPS